MKFRLLPLTLLAVFGLAVAAGPDYPLDAPAPDGRRPGGTLTQEFTPPPLKDEENKDLRRERIDVDDTSRKGRSASADRSASTSRTADKGGDSHRGLGERLADAADNVKDRVDGNPRSRPGRDATDSDRRI